MTTVKEEHPMPVTTLDGRQSIAVGEGCLTSPTARAQQVGGLPATRARRSHRGTVAGVTIPARIQREDNALEPQPADIGCDDVTTSIRARQLFSHSQQSSFRHGNVARPL
jgi:hypothetical protein